MDGDAADLVDAVLAVDRVGRLERPRGERAGHEERLHDRPGLEAVAHDPIAAPVDVALGVVVRVVPGDARQREDLARRGIDDGEGAALRLVGAHRRVELALGHVLDALVDREDDVVALEGLGLLASLEDEAPAPVAQAADLLDLAAQVFVEGELEPVLALRVGRHEPEDGARQLAAGVVAVALAFDGETPDGVGLALRVSQIADRLGLVAGDATLDPREPPARRQLGVDVVRVEGERFGDPGGGVAQRRLLGRVAFDAAEELDGVGAHARDFDAHGERRAVAVVEGAPLRLDVQAALALLLGHVAPLGGVFDLDAPGAGDDAAEGEAHDAAKDPHARADPPSATGVEVLHGSAPFRPTAVGGCATGAASFAAVCGRAGSATIRSGGGGSIPRSVRATISTRSGVL